MGVELARGVQGAHEGGAGLLVERDQRGVQSLREEVVYGQVLEPHSFLGVNVLLSSLLSLLLVLGLQEVVEGREGLVLEHGVFVEEQLLLRVVVDSGKHLEVLCVQFLEHFVDRFPLLHQLLLLLHFCVCPRVLLPFVLSRGTVEGVVRGLVRVVSLADGGQLEEVVEAALPVLGLGAEQTRHVLLLPQGVPLEGDHAEQLLVVLERPVLLEDVLRSNLVRPALLEVLLRDVGERLAWVDVQWIKVNRGLRLLLVPDALLFLLFVVNVLQISDFKYITN